MVTKIEFLKRMARLYLMTVMMYTFGGIGATRLYGPSFGIIESGDSFETRTVSHIKDCIEQCERWTSCKVVNYRIRGRMCYLVHHIGEMAVDISRKETPGFVSWTKPDVNLVSITQIDVCPQCYVTQSCEVNPTDGTCKISACGNPPKYAEISLHGNIYKVGSQLAYICYDHDNNETYPHIIECATDGTWTNLRNMCVYTNYSLPDETTIMLRVFDIMVNQATAMRKCQTDGSSLITVLSVEKINLLRSILSGSQVDYWIDIQRVNDTFWQTSDGREQPMDYSMLSEYDFNDPNHYCARLRASHNWKIHDMRCSRNYGFICERVA